MTTNGTPSSQALAAVAAVRAVHASPRSALRKAGADTPDPQSLLTATVDLMAGLSQLASDPSIGELDPALPGDLMSAASALSGTRDALARLVGLDGVRASRGATSGLSQAPAAAVGGAR